MQELTNSYMKKYVHMTMTAWEDFPEWEKISDEDIKEMIFWKDEGGKRHRIKHSESSDAARKAILRIYSYETPLYGALNRANQCQDQRAIKTLGPFAELLSYVISSPGEENEKAQKSEHKGWIFKEENITLYRGLGLPEKAI